MEEKWLQKATLSKRQPSSTVIVEAALSATKLLEYSAKALKASAAAFRVAQSALPRHSWMHCNKASKLWGEIPPTCNKVIINFYRTSICSYMCNLQSTKICSLLSYLICTIKCIIDIPINETIKKLQDFHLSCQLTSTKLTIYMINIPMN